MLSVLTVLAVLLAQPVAYLDRFDTVEDRAALLMPVASAIAEVSRTPEEAAALIALGAHETHFARYVIEGRCLDGPRGMQCDRDPHTGRPRARGPFQVWSWCRSAWSSPDGSSESLRGGADCAIRMLRSARFRCSTRNADVLAGMFSGYRSASCTWPPARARVATMEHVLAQFWRAG